MHFCEDISQLPSLITRLSFLFPFSYEFLLCVCYFGRQIDTPLRAGIACRLTNQVKSHLEDLWERVRCQSRLWKSMAI